MKLGELFIQLGVQGDTKELKKTLADMEKADKLSNIELKKRKALKEATTAEDKALIQETADRKKEIIQTKDAITKKENMTRAVKGVVRGFAAFATAAGIVYHAVDRMANALVSANAKMITFNRTTGIGFGSLNKYASAAMAVNPNATIEGTAQTMQNLAQNLYDIRMGRGDISPYQELAFVGGKPFNPMGMNVEQVIESVREAIKGVNDIQATNIITRMGFSPEDLQMLRMSRQEIEGIQSLFLNSSEREEIQRLGIEYKKTQLQIQLYWQRGLIQLIPALIKVMNIMKKVAKQLTDTITLWGEAFDRVTNLARGCDILTNSLKALAVAAFAIFAKFHPFIAGLTALYFVLEDIVGYFLGWHTVIIPALKMFGEWLVNWINDIGDRIKEKGGWINAIGGLLGTLGGALGGGALGASVGSMFGPLGTAIGVGIGSIGGAFAGLDWGTLLKDMFSGKYAKDLLNKYTPKNNSQDGKPIGAAADINANIIVNIGDGANDKQNQNNKGYVGILPNLTPVPVGQNPNISYNNQSSNVTQNNNFRISALPENMAGEVGDSLTKASYNAIIAQNMVVA